MAARRTVICGSPHAGGASQRACGEAVELLEKRFPGDAVQMIAAGRLGVEGCVGCDACRDTHRCFRRDAMDGVLEALAASDELYLAVPVYFAGVPSQFKAVLDRLQPLYWKWADTPRGDRVPFRPARLMVIGGGGDPHGFEPLVGSVRSALAVARFSVERVEASIGDDPRGHIRAWLEAR